MEIVSRYPCAEATEASAVNTAPNDGGERDKIDLKIRVHQDVNMESLPTPPRANEAIQVSTVEPSVARQEPGRAGRESTPGPESPSARRNCVKHVQKQPQAVAVHVSTVKPSKAPKRPPRTSLHEHRDVHNQELCRRTMGEEERAEEVFGSFFFLLFLFFFLPPLNEGGLSAHRRHAAQSAALLFSSSSSFSSKKARAEESTATQPSSNRGTHNSGADSVRAPRGSDPCGSDTAASLSRRHPPSSSSSSNSVKSSGSSLTLVVSCPRGASCVPGHPPLGALW